MGKKEDRIGLGLHLFEAYFINIIVFGIIIVIIVIIEGFALI